MNMSDHVSLIQTALADATGLSFQAVSITLRDPGGMGIPMVTLHGQVDQPGSAVSFWVYYLPREVNPGWSAREPENLDITLYTFRDAVLQDRRQRLLLLDDLLQDALRETQTHVQQHDRQAARYSGLMQEKVRINEFLARLG
jgi:hypothetical protein